MQSLVVSPLVSNLVLSRTGGVLSHLNFLTHIFPRFPPRNLCCVVTLAVSSRLRCNRCSFLLSSYLSSIGRIENPSCCACGHSSQDISHLILRCPATDSLHRSLLFQQLLATLCLSTTSGLGPKKPSGAPWLPPCSIRRNGSGNNNNNNKRKP